jgi:hypothetical protein
MGNLITHDRLTVHSHQPARQRRQGGSRLHGPADVTVHAVSASVQSPATGATMLPLSAPVASYAADGAPFYSTGYLYGYGSRAAPGAQVPLLLPPRAAMVDLLDMSSWDRPVQWYGVA